MVSKYVITPIYSVERNFLLVYFRFSIFLAAYNWKVFVRSLKQQNAGVLWSIDFKQFVEDKYGFDSRSIFPKALLCVADWYDSGYFYCKDTSEEFHNWV